jgi:hypothetical protein
MKKQNQILSIGVILENMRVSLQSYGNCKKDKLLNSPTREDSFKLFLEPCMKLHQNS